MMVGHLVPMFFALMAAVLVAPHLDWKTAYGFSLLFSGASLVAVVVLP